MNRCEHSNEHKTKVDSASSDRSKARASQLVRVFGQSPRRLLSANLFQKDLRVVNMGFAYDEPIVEKKIEMFQGSIEKFKKFHSWQGSFSDARNCSPK